MLDIPSGKEYWPVHYLYLYFIRAILCFLFFLIRCDEPTFNYTLLRYHLAMLAIDDLYNYAQSNRSNLVFLLFVGVLFPFSFLLLHWLDIARTVVAPRSTRGSSGMKEYWLW